MAMLNNQVALLLSLIIHHGVNENGAHRIIISVIIIKNHLIELIVVVSLFYMSVDRFR